MQKVALALRSDDRPGALSRAHARGSGYKHNGVRNELTKYCCFAFGLMLSFWLSGSAVAQTKQPSAVGNSEVVELRKRVEQLEEQLVDMQVVLGTLETLARSGGSGTVAGAGNNQIGSLSRGDAGRVSALETQVRALSAQLQQMSRSSGGATAGQNANVQGWSGNSQVRSNRQAGASGTRSGFGSTTVQPGSGPTIGNLIRRDNLERTDLRTNGSAPPRNPQAEYEAAYGLLLQQDYGAARQAFSTFVEANPRHALAGNAQYWLGETYYVQGQYKNAAGAFLTGYRTYKSGAKAPDSLLKLAMSLDRLGQRSAACSSLNELGTKYPRAPQHVTRRVGQEIRRLRC